MLAGMFAGLSDAALSNAGIDRQKFLAALAGNRALLKDYLQALGLPSDDAWIDASISAYPGRQLLGPCLGVVLGLPTASPSPS
jgi:hypothetical protein